MKKTKTRILVTGGAGFIGAHLTEKLIKNGHQVLVVDTLMKQGGIPFINKKSKFIKGDITNKKIINKIKCKNAIKKANKLMSNKGRILVRKSGTEPKIRIMAESHDKSLILKCIKIIKRSIKN